jgi:hypothetical protein
VHDPYALQAPDGVTEVFAHASYLSVKTLSEHDPEGVTSNLCNPAGIRDCVQNWNATRHPIQEFGCQGSVDRDDVFFLMLILSPQNDIDDVPIIGQEDEPLGILIQTTDGENTFRKSNKVDDVVRSVTVCGALDTDRFIERQINALRLLPQFATVEQHQVAVFDLGSEFGGYAVH